jgi:hypothetical protein
LGAQLIVGTKSIRCLAGVGSRRKVTRKRTADCTSCIESFRAKEDELVGGIDGVLMGMAVHKVFMPK